MLHVAFWDWRNKTFNSNEYMNSDLFVFLCLFLCLFLCFLSAGEHFNHHTHTHITHTLSNYHTRQDQSLTANKTHIQSLRSFSWNRKLHMFLKFHIKPLHSLSCRGEGSQACLWAWGRKDLKPRWFLSYHHISRPQSPLYKHPRFTAFLAGLAYQAAFALSN